MTSQGLRVDEYKKTVLPSAVFNIIAAVLLAQSSLIGRPVFLSLDCQLITLRRNGRLSISHALRANRLGQIDARDAGYGLSPSRKVVRLFFLTLD